MVNWDRVRGLRDEVGAEDFDEIIALFFSEVESVVERLTDISEAKPMSDTLHFLKSGALNLGFDDFADMCSAGEKAAKEGSMAEIDPPAIQSCYETAKTRFHADAETELAK